MTQIFESGPPTSIKSIHVPKENGPQRGFAPVEFNNQIELVRDTSMITRQHCVGLYHTDGGHISQNPKQTRALMQRWLLI